MPVRHRQFGDDLSPPEPKRCKHCDDGTRKAAGGKFVRSDNKSHRNVQWCCYHLYVTNLHVPLIIESLNVWQQLSGE
ncbi:hypothetical protein KGM_213533 [Danaus plexippus plexippus]|uniref:Uncharacterized protein n=1 Tax=Danaus plexippus plexippus TaxID=278856 RepID=A0A212ENS8_DANPL|nr:hypothetical protein KGM_213533 [Danaus plexippus plexippus]